MNLVEAVNKALGTNGTNLQDALNEAAGVDASNVTEAISKIEGGGGGMVIPELTVVVEQEANGTYTSTVPFAEMLQLIRNSSYQTDGRNIYPAYLDLTIGGESAGADFTGVQINGELIWAGSFSLHADGTVSSRYN